MSSDQGLIEALEPIARIFHSLDIGFYVGGSIASSFHGAARSTMDVDLVADLRLKHIKAFMSRLGNEEYYVS